MKIGFIGCGNMGGAIARAISKGTQHKIYIFDKNNERCDSFSKEIGAFSSSDDYIAKNCDFIFLAVKPNIIENVILSIKDSLEENGGAILVSMAAGVKISKIKAILDKKISVIRIMPNTPVAVGSGMTTWCPDGEVSQEGIKAFEEIMSATGQIDRIPEELIDAATAIAGCGPAFAYMFIDALAEAGESFGIEKEKALIYASQMIIGSCKMVLSGGCSPSVLRERVCSPGGSTIEGVLSLEKDNFSEIVKRAASASFEKTKKLG